MKKKFILLYTLCIFSRCIAQYTDLFDFNGTNGYYPSGGLTLAGNLMYGMTSQGGINGNGNIFSIHSDGSGFNVLFEFDAINGKWPMGSVTESGSVLYGMTYQGGKNNAGIVFSINADGSGYKVLLDFNGANGSNPIRSLTLSSNVLYGTTESGGFYGHGTIFSINTDGSGFTKLFDFNGINGDQPRGDLTLSSGVLYGMTRAGNIFSINTDGSAFNNLFFINGINGSDLQGSLTISGNVLYGVSFSGGPMEYDYRNDGFIFSINTDGTGYQDLHDFNGMDGKNPVGNLVLIGNVLYGTAYNGGINDNGCLFSISTEGTGFSDIFDFNCTNIMCNGGQPSGYLTDSVGILYGTAKGGANGYGVIFSLNMGITTAINKVEKEIEMKLFPNPASKIISISITYSDTKAEFMFKVSDSLGKTVYSENLKDISGSFNKQIDLSHLPKGIYFVELQSNSPNTSKKKTEIKKIILQ